MTDKTNDPLDGLMTTARAAAYLKLKPDALTRAIARFPEYAPGKLGNQHIWTQGQARAVGTVATRISEGLCPHCGKDPRGVRKPTPAPDVTPPPLSSTKPDKGGNGTGK